MYVDKFEISNIVSPLIPKLIDAVQGNISVKSMQSILVEAGLLVLNAQTEKRNKRPCNISSSIDLITNQRDKNGIRRYSLRCIDDEPVMLPDSKGFWTPINKYEDN